MEIPIKKTVLTVFSEKKNPGLYNRSGRAKKLFFAINSNTIKIISSGQTKKTFFCSHKKIFAPATGLNGG